MRNALGAMLAAALWGFAASAVAQTYPSRPITFIEPFAAGGPSDAVARVVAQAMSQTLGQSVAVENITGAAGTIAAARLARAAPDGYTIGMATWSTHVVSPVVYHPSYNVFKDFAPVALLTETPLMLVANKKIPADNLHGLIAWLKANPDTAFQGVAGGTDQVIGFLFQKRTGTKFQTVPYRGLRLAMQDLVAGRIDLLFDQPSDALPQIQAGTIKAYAVTAKRRLTLAPDIPTVDEAGLSGLLPDAVAIDLGAARNARGRHCRAQYRCGRSACRPRRAQATRGSCPGGRATRPANAVGTRLLLHCRD